jgi:hypothetical protein
LHWASAGPAVSKVAAASNVIHFFITTSSFWV